MNAGRIKGNVEVSRRATSQPFPTLSLRTSSTTPQFNSAGENSSKTYETRPQRQEELGFATRAADGPQSVLQAKSPIEEDRASANAKPEVLERLQQHHVVWLVERTPTPDNTVARQATDLT